MMIMYALNLGEDGRILSATYPKYAAPHMPIVDTLPDGDVNEYRYVDGAYIHDPLPTTEATVEPEPTTDEVLNTLLGVE
jgi:hypothetical protein